MHHRSVHHRLYTTALLALLAGSTATLAQPAAAPPATTAPATAAAPDYVRSQIDDETGRSRLELAIRTFAVPGADGQDRTVSLVAAVHIADKTFYDQMQTYLDKQDVVLFEGVKPPGAGKVDATATDEVKIKATKRRLEFLLKVLDKNRAEHNTYATSLDELAAQSDARFGPIVKGLINDAWGHPVTLERKTTAAAGDKDATETITLSSSGPDGKPGGEHSDDLQATGKALPIGKPDPDAKTNTDPGIQKQLADALGLTFQLQGMKSGKPNWRNSDMAIDEVQDRIAAQGGDAEALFAMLDGSSLPAKLASFLLYFVKMSPRLSAIAKIAMVQVLAESDKLMGGGGPGGKGIGGLNATTMKVILLDRNGVVIDDIKQILATEPAVHTIAAFYGAGHMGNLEQRLITELHARPTGETWYTAITVDPKDAGLSAKEVKQMRDMMRKQFERMAPKPDKAAPKGD